MDEDKIKDLVGIPKFVYVHSIIKGIVNKDIESSLKAIDDILNEGKDLENFLWEMIKHTRDILMYKVSKKKDIYNEEEMKKIEELAEKVSKEELINIIYKLSELENKMKMSSQKTIVFETEIIKLCVKTEILESKIDTTVEVTSDHIQELKPKIKTEPEPKKAPKTNTKNAPLLQGNKISQWQTVIESLKNQGKVMLYANLINTDAVEINDMTVAIRFYNGLNGFRKDLIEKHENMSALVKEISIIYGKPMQIKLEDARGEKNAKSSDSNLGTIP
ncbi:MAG: hypothetical protein K2H53_07055, partial [Clostridia bacterium]|nr:hypothetical protein [Clostridia bacterium]